MPPGEIDSIHPSIIFPPRWYDAVDYQSQRIMIEFIQLLEKLNSPRRGWPQRGVPESEAETISAHMYQMAMILMAYPWVRQK